MDQYKDIWVVENEEDREKARYTVVIDLETEKVELGLSELVYDAIVEQAIKDFITTAIKNGIELSKNQGAEVGID